MQIVSCQLLSLTGSQGTIKGIVFGCHLDDDCEHEDSSYTDGYICLYPPTLGETIVLRPRYGEGGNVARLVEMGASERSNILVIVAMSVLGRFFGVYELSSVSAVRLLLTPINSTIVVSDRAAFFNYRTRYPFDYEELRAQIMIYTDWCINYFLWMFEAEELRIMLAHDDAIRRITLPLDGQVDELAEMEVDFIHQFATFYDPDDGENAVLDFLRPRGDSDDATVDLSEDVLDTPEVIDLT